MTDLDRRQFLRRGLMVLGALMGAGAIAELAALTAAHGSSTATATVGVAIPSAVPATTAAGTGSTWLDRFVVPRQRVTPATSPVSPLAQLELTQLGWLAR